MWLLVPAILVLHLGQGIGQGGPYLLARVAILTLIIGRQGVVIKGRSLANGVVFTL